VTVAKRFPRRDFLFTSTAGGIACLAGCKPNQAPEGAASVRTDVPLRVLICGDVGWGEAISTAWSGIAQQPLAIETLPPASAVDGNLADAVGIASFEGGKPSSDLARRVLASLSRSDVAIVPCGLVADIAESDALVPLGDDLVQAEELAADRFFPVISQSLMRWAGRPVAIPLGCLQPSMLISVELAARLGQAGEAGLPKNWGDFDRVLQQVAVEGTAAEPLTGGAAAKMFLWRASEAAPPVWLFDRVSFEPVLEQEAYVKTLQTMRQNVQHYGATRKSSGQVWSDFAAGKLSIAIGWPAEFGDPPRVDSIGDAIATALPTTANVVDSGLPSLPVLPDADSPIAIISSRCRQTAAAKRFLIWLSGGEGTELVRGAIGAISQVRRDNDSTNRESESSATSDYANFLAQRLLSLNLRPTIRLHGYDRYMAALDREVLACLDGKQTPAEALVTVTGNWQAITAAIGPERQAKAWRLAQGLRN
jgi:hypothetical protein